ncbi:MAG: ABC transporter permease [Acutalibacteraceae bacterium]|nr:ABC transporter permease [Acutalibacteraceae bacterium]
MSTVKMLLKRNIKLFFKDKAMFFTSLITPVILLVLYATFLSNVYTDVFHDSLAGAIEVSESLIRGCVGGQLVSSILAVSCVTVAFCSNMLMVQDKVTGASKDFKISPVKPSALAVSYYIATLASTLIICFAATGICLLYIAAVGWYMSALDVILLFADVILLVLFGTALSSIINFFLSTQGQISAVGTIVSSAYGFICGAYMPISQFGTGLQRVLSFLPGTYGTSLVRNHALRGVFEEMESIGFPSEVIEAIRDSVDCNLYFFGNKVDLPVMYLILGGSVIALVGIYIAMNVVRGKKV